MQWQVALIYQSDKALLPIGKIALLVAKRLDRIELSGAAGREIAEDHADRRREGKGERSSSG
jgi:hypothetical protein